MACESIAVFIERSQRAQRKHEEQNVQQQNYLFLLRNKLYGECVYHRNTSNHRYRWGKTVLCETTAAVSFYSK